MAAEAHGAAAQRAVQRAYAARKVSPSIITENLTSEFRAARAQMHTNLVQGLPSPGGVARAAGMRRSAGRRATSGYTLDRVYDVPFNPFRNRQAVETPRNLSELRNRYRYYYEYEPLVASAIDLHRDFPLSGFRLTHSDESVQRFFNDVVEKLNLFDFILQMGHEYWAVGEVFTFGFLDDPSDPTMWTGFILLDPDYVDLAGTKLATGPEETELKLRFDDSIARIVENGPNHPDTGEAYKKIPQDVMDYVKAGKSMPLNSLQASHIKRSGNPHDLHGESIIKRVLHILAYRDKLRDAQVTVADRHCSPKEFYFVGNDEQPADDEELADFANALSASWMDPNQALIWHHAVNVQIIGTADKILPLQSEFDALENELLAGLMMSRSFMFGETTYANASVALEVLISRYITYRQRIERWLINHVFAPLCQFHGIYKQRDEGKVQERFKKYYDKQEGEKPLDLPEIKWDKTELRNDMERIRMLEALADKGWIPRAYVLQASNIDPDAANKVLASERRQYEKQLEQAAPQAAPGVIPPPTGAGGGSSTEGPGGLPPLPTGGEAVEDLIAEQNMGGATSPAESYLPPGAGAPGT